jgi:hypothetical protein
VVACIVFIYMKIFVCFIKQASLLAACMHELCTYVVYANEHSRINAVHVIFLYMKIFVCLIKQAHLLAIISKFGGGGGYNSILWLSFAQPKYT